MMVRRRKRADGSAWVAYYYQPAGTKDAVPLGSDLLVAKARWAALEGETVAAGTVADIRARHMKSDGRLVEPRTQADREDYWRRLEPVFGHVSMDALKPPHMLAYFDARTAKHSAKKELKYLSVLCTWARSRGLMTAPHPLADGIVRMMKTVSGPKRYVTDEEFNAVRDQAHPLMQDFMDLLYFTGQRPADVRGILWADVHADHLVVFPGKTARATGAGMRIDLVGPLKRVIGRIKGRGVRGLGTVLVAPDGQPLKEFGWARSEFDRARKAAGVSFELRHIRPKSATDIEDTGSIKDAQKLLGHATEQMTAHYIRQHAGSRVSPVTKQVTKITKRPKP